VFMRSESNNIQRNTATRNRSRHVLVAKKSKNRRRGISQQLRRQLRNQWLILRVTGDLQNRKTENVSLFIHALHDSVIRCLAHEARLVRKANFEKVGICVEPDSYFFGHAVSPV